MTRVFWKEHEEQSVALKAAEIYHDDRNVPIGNKPRTWRESLVAAQYAALINPARHKPAPSFRTWPKKELDRFWELGNRLRDAKLNINKELEEQAQQQNGVSTSLLDLAECAAPAPTSAPTSAPQPQLITGPANPPEIQIPENLELPPATSESPEQIHYNTSRRVQALIRLMVKHTVSSFEQQLELALTEAMDKAFEQVHERVTARVSHLAAKANVRKPTVAILGLLPKFFEAINKEYSDFFNITFISKDNENVDLVQRLKNKDYVIVNTDFTSHSVTQTIRDHKGLIFAPGNNAVKDKLLELAANL